MLLCGCCYVTCRPSFYETSTFQILDSVHKGASFSGFGYHINTVKDQMDTYWCPGTEESARVAAGGVTELLAEVFLHKHVRNGFAAVRPPGHHAAPCCIGGFCYYNNVGVAVRALQSRIPDARVLIVDWGSTFFVLWNISDI